MSGDPGSAEVPSAEEIIPAPATVESIVGMTTSAAGPAVDAIRLHGETPIRGITKVPLSPIHEGRFGRMFRRLPPMAPAEPGELEDLAELMREVDAPTGWDGTPQARDNDRIPAGYTYLGQFIDHDITFDPASVLQQENDPDALHDFRSPRFDLDSLYGSGPIDEPFQYRRGTHGLEMLIEPNDNGVDDLPRNSQGIALIGDPRNDENVIVSQLQLLFLRLHNKIGLEVRADASVAEEQRFTETARRVRWLYQWVVVHDYLKKTIGDPMFETLYDEEGEIPNIKRRFYLPKKDVYMPVEFSAAAFRFGHSQVRGIYDLNADVVGKPIFISGDLPDQFADLRGFRAMPPAWAIEWERFFVKGGSTPQPSRMIDTRLVPALFDLPDTRASLALKNLQRGQALGLPSGQDVAGFLGLPVLTSSELGGVPEPTPLWFYILKESEVREGGLCLGPVGGRIIGEVLLGLLEADPMSWFSASPLFRPTIPDADGDGVIGMADLIAFVES